MDDTAIFEHLFEVAKRSRDPRGVVASCIVRDGRIIAAAPSASDGIRHSEDIALEQISGIDASASLVLYTTLEPCSRRTKPGMIDCTTLIIAAGISRVVYGASDPDHSEMTRTRLSEAGITDEQVQNTYLVRRCAEIFNNSVTNEHKHVDVKLKPLQ